MTGPLALRVGQTVVTAIERSETVEKQCGQDDHGGRIAPDLEPGAALVKSLLEETAQTGIQVPARTTIGIDVFPGLRIDQRIEW